MKRILGILLMVILLTIPFSSVYALETPQQPEAGDFTTNEEITEYNNKVDKYNEEVDKYNAAVDEEYNAAVEQVNQQNAAGIQAQEQSQQAHDAAVAANEQAQQEADERNAEIDNENEQIKADNTAEDQKVLDRQEEIKAVNERNNQAIIKAESDYQAALQAEEERIAQLQDENTAIEQWNQSELDRVAAIEQANAEEEERVNTANAAALAAYEAEKARIIAENAVLQTNYEEEKAAVETNNTFVENVENKVTADSSEARGFENNTTSVNELPTDWSDNLSENLKTIQVIQSETPTGNKIKVINLHVYLKEGLGYNDLEPTFYNSIENYNFNLSENIKNNAILTEWEIAEIDYDDTVTLISESTAFAGNIVWLNGKRSWFGANPLPYFMRSIEGYTQGYWMNDGDMLATTATEQDYGWSAGTAYTVHHAEETATSNYLENGELKTEEITVRTTDKQEPKNIFALFTYAFTRLAAEPETQELPEEPTLQDLPEEPILETFTPQEIIPAALKELNEIIPNIITKEDPVLEDVPEEYTPQYKDLLEHVIPTLVEVPEVVLWEALGYPEKGEYLAYLDKMDLFDVPEPTPEDPEPESIPTEPTIAPVNPTPAIIVYGGGDGDPEPVVAEPEPTIITNPPTPKAEPEAEAYWALLNLILSILTVILALLFVFKKKEENDDEEEESEEDKDEKKAGISKLIAALVALASVIIFVLTEDMSLPMQWVDQWTLLMMLVFLGEAGTDYYIYKKNQAEDDDEE